MKQLKLLLICLAMISLIGCGQKETEIEEDVVTVLSVVQEEAEKSEQHLELLPKTKEELLTMDLEEFKKMLTESIPDYRDHFKVPVDYVIEDSDWENFRIILSLELFGSARLDKENNNLKNNTDNEEADSNAIYYNPSPEEIKAMTDEEFVLYLSDLQAYLYPDSEAVDYSKLTTEQIQIVRENMISE